MSVEIHSFDPDSPYFEGAVRVYTSSTGHQFTGSVNFFKNYAQKPDYIGRVALDNQQVVGVGFGTKCQPGDWWHDKVAGKVGEDNPLLKDAWVLVELHVLEDYRNHGIGGRLLEQLTELQPYDTMLLSTPVSNEAAQRFYERHGWDYLHPGFRFYSGQEPYCIMYKQIKED